MAAVEQIGGRAVQRAAPFWTVTRLRVAAIVVIIAVSIFVFLKTQKVEQSEVVGAQPSDTQFPLREPVKSKTIFPSDSANAAPVEGQDAQAHLELSAVPASTERQNAVDQVVFVLRDYRLALSQNPTGTNAEITSCLMGNNLKQTRFEIPEGSRVENGEMCDFWGTPYFFHQIDALTMEIRSAGPDRQMWTGDDIIAK